MTIDLIRLFAFIPCGIAVAVGFVRRMELAFIGFLAMLSLVPAQEIAVLPGGRTVVWMLGILVMGLWALKRAIRGTIPRIGSPPLVIAFLWITWSALSVFWAREQGISWNSAVALYELLAFFLLIQLMITGDLQLRTAALLYFTAAAIVAGLAIVVALSTGLERAFLSGVQNPNVLARALATGLLITPYLIKRLERPSRRWIILGAVVLTIAILLTGSRGAWVSLAAATGITWLLVGSKFVRVRTMAALLVVLGLGIGALYSAGIVGDFLIRRIVTIADVEATNGWSGRTRIWAVGWEMVKAQPLAGVGLGNFTSRFDEYIAAAGQTGKVKPRRDPHNTFLSVQAETGIVGLVLYLLLFYVIFRRLVSVRGDPRAVLGILLLSFAFVTGVSGTVTYMKFFWLDLGFAAAIPEVIRRAGA